jgi:SnoaL-like protein
LDHLEVTDVDRWAIQELSVRYARAVDDRDFELLGTVFTPDAAFGQASEIVGRDAIVAHIRALLQGCGESQHLLGNHVVTVDGARARMSCAVRAFHRGAGDRRELVYEMLGDYHDDVRRTAVGWLISRRWLDARIRIGPRTLVLGLDADMSTPSAEAATGRPEG